MADVAADTIIETSPRAGRLSFPIADTIVLYAGTLVQLSAGYLDHWDDAGAGSTFMGILIGGKDRVGDGVLTGQTADDPDPRGFVDTSGVTLMHLASINGTPTQAKVGDLIYCGTSNTDDMDLQSSGNTNPIGWLKEFRTATDCDVQLFTPAEFLCIQTESA